MIPGVPYDAEIEYLESTGTQWIDTGILANSDLKVECAFRMLESPTTFKWIFAARTQDIAGDGYGFGCNGNGYITSDYNGRVSISERFNSGTIYTVVKDANVCSMNGTTFLNTATIFTQSHTLPILGMRTANGDVNLGVIPKCEIFHVRIYAQTLVRDLIPVRVGQTGYMYDRVSQTLFGNQGSGNFILGKDIHWTKTLNTRIKNRYDTEENWLTENPILLSGETAFADISGVHKCKVGDGETPYTGLPYVNNMDEAMIIRKWRD